MKKNKKKQFLWAFKRKIYFFNKNYCICVVNKKMNDIS